MKVLNVALCIGLVCASLTSVDANIPSKDLPSNYDRFYQTKKSPSAQFVWAKKEEGDATSRSVQLHYSPLKHPSRRAEAAAKMYVLQQADRLRASKPDIESANLLTTVHAKGVRVVQLKQTINNIEVFGKQINVVVNRRGDVIAASGGMAKRAELRLEKQIKKRQARILNNPSLANQVISQQQALSLAVSDLGIANVDADTFTYGRKEGRYSQYKVNPNSSIVGTPRVKAVYYDAGNHIHDAYYLEVMVHWRDPSLVSEPQDILNALTHPAQTLRHFGYVISRAEGKILYRKNLMHHANYNYRAYVDDMGEPLDSPLGDVSPFESGYDVERPPMVEAPLISLRHGPISTGDAWLADDAVNTMGNNVFAVADIAPPRKLLYELHATDENGFDASGDMIGVTSSNNAFDYALDMDLPLEHVQNRQAAITNLFYVTNWLHDWYYDAGFDEQSGNAQQNNYGRGGIENDGIIATAHHYSGTNNAFMGTPADGGHPYMGMFLWDEKPIESGVTHKVSMHIEGEKKSFFAHPISSSARRSTFSAESIDVVEYIYDSATQSCVMERELPEDSSGIAFINVEFDCFKKTGLFDHQYVRFALGLIHEVIDQGASAVLFSAHHEEGLPTWFYSLISGSRERVFEQPVFLALSNEWNQLEGWEQGRINYPLHGFVDLGWLDSAFDNGIIAHEYGHYVQNRLIFDGSGLINNQGLSMGEGWSDFHTLLMLVRPEDTGIPGNASFEGIYNSGAYVVNNFYFGIRRAPYSTDTKVNALTFKHIERGVPLPDSHPVKYGQDGRYNSSLHASGEIWANVLWEVYTKLLTKRSISFKEAQIRMRDYLILGYKMTPFAPTYTEARDALLAVVYATDKRDYRLFLEAFAKRGMGFGAQSPERFDSEHRGVVESFKAEAAIIKSSSLSLDTQYTSGIEGYCSNDNVWDVGETVEMTAILANTGSEILLNVKAAFTSTADIVFENAGMVKVRALKPYEQKEVKIKARLNSASFRENIIIFFDVLFARAFRNDVELPESLEISMDVNYAFERQPITNGVASEHVDDPLVTLNDWQLTWQWGESEMRPFYVVPDGTGNNQIFGENRDSSSSYAFESPWFSAQEGNVTVQFDHRFDFEQSYDGGFLEVRMRDTQWQDVEAFGAVLAEGYSGVIPVFENGMYVMRPAYTGVRESLTELIDFGLLLSGKEFQFRFRVINDDIVSARGWALDDVIVSGVHGQGFSHIVPETQTCQ